MEKTFAEKILAFNNSLNMDDIKLPKGIRAMNPFHDEGSEQVNEIAGRFYKKFYGDTNPRRLILGINPGRFGAGQTGVPFSDTKRLRSDCGIDISTFETHEPSSVFVYEVVRAYGGAEEFYGDFYINSICPLGFVILNNKGREVNYNYYDDPNLEKAVMPFILKTVQQQIDFGVDTETCFCLGSGKNYKFLKKLNEKHQFFGRIVPLDHPRFVVQYRSKKMNEYIQKYLDAFSD